MYQTMSSMSKFRISSVHLMTQNFDKHDLEYVGLMAVFTPVQQGGAVHRLTEALKEREAAATELSLLIEELQALRHNLTALRGQR